MNLLRKTKWS